ncbi:patatin family protein [Clostridiaceae bacterium NSJ-31]|uniref:Patatin family protein n=1 Tax=Ligaoa zhengdingensis TaxID=2763658 RepID=A0A926E1B3_9FIRM|nr:patatin family protein [Ligaoa zhengdingensis]MBC8547557.1 patatin family protein [Ligaoa zhengdingensis]
MKSVILLEGGSYRGIYTAGILDVFMEHDLYPDCVVGVSAGALNGMCYVAKQPGRVKDVTYAYGLDPRYAGEKAIRREHNMIGLNFILHEVPQYIPFDKDTFYHNKVKFYAAVTNCVTGKQEYIDRDQSSNIMKAIAASASMPFLNRRVEIEGIPYLDGGIANKTPLHFLDIHPEYDRVIFILTRESTYQKAKPSQVICKAAERFYRSFPKLVEDIKNENLLYEEERERIFTMANNKEALVIAPKQPLNIGHLEKNIDSLCRGYQIGRKDGYSYCDDVKDYLA